MGAQRTTCPHASSLPCRPRAFANVPYGSNASCLRLDEPKMLSIGPFNPGPPLARLGSAAALTPAWHLRIGPLTLLSSPFSKSGGWHGRGPESRQKVTAAGGQGMLLLAEESGDKGCS